MPSVFLPSGLALALICAGCVAPQVGRVTGIDPIVGEKELVAERLAYPSEPLLRLNAAAGAMAGIAMFASDESGKLIATMGVDKSVVLWNGETGELLRVIRQPEYRERGGLGSSRMISVSPDGKFVAFAADAVEGRTENAVFVFDVKDDKLVHRLGPLEAPVSHVVFSRDGHLLTVGLSDLSKRYTGIETYRVVDGMKIANTSFATSRDTDRMINAVLYRDDNRLLVTRGDECSVYSYDFLSQRMTMEHRIKVPHLPHGDQGISIDYSGKYLFGCSSGAIVFLDAKTLGSTKSTKLKADSGVDMRFPTQLGTQDQVLANMTYFKGAAVWSNVASALVLADSSGRITKLLNEAAVFIGPIGRERVGFVTRQGLFEFRSAQEQRVLISSGSFCDADIRRPADFLATPDVDSIFVRRHDGSTLSFSLAKASLNDRAYLPERRAIRGLTLLEMLGKPGPQWGPTTGFQHWGSRLSGLLKWEIPGCVVRDPNENWLVVATMMSRLIVYDHPGVIRWQRPAPGPTLMTASDNAKRMAVAMYDGTIRWYDMANGDEICSLFLHADKKKWVLWTPEGYFNCSPGAEGLVGYLVNRGPGREADFVAIDQMYDAFYRPDLVAKKIRGEDLKEMTEALAKTGDAASVIAKGLPPTVEIIDPKDGVVDATVTVRAMITDAGSGIGRLIWRVNGTRMDGRGLSVVPTGARREVSVELQLPRGESEITLTAYNSDNLIESRPAKIRVTVAASQKPSGKPTLYVLAVGVNAYRDSSLALNYSVPDAKALAKLLKECGTGLYQNVVVTQLHDQQATRDGIRKAAAELSGKMKSDDVFVLYLAGHGLALDGVYYFLPWELIFQNEDAVKTQALGQQELQEMLATVPALRSVVLLDTCNSGAFATPEMRGLTVKTAMAKLTRGIGRATLSASTESQAAMEGYEGHGVFTYALLQGLKGAADKGGNGDKQVSVNEWADYVGTSVPELTKAKWGYEQFPMQNLQGRPFVIGDVR